MLIPSPLDQQGGCRHIKHWVSSVQDDLPSEEGLLSLRDLSHGLTG